jgi:hypothetical protein
MVSISDELSTSMYVDQQMETALFIAHLSSVHTDAEFDLILQFTKRQKLKLSMVLNGFISAVFHWSRHVWHNPEHERQVFDLIYAQGGLTAESLNSRDPSTGRNAVMWSLRDVSYRHQIDWLMDNAKKFIDWNSALPTENTPLMDLLTYNRLSQLAANALLTTDQQNYIDARCVWVLAQMSDDGLNHVNTTTRMCALTLAIEYRRVKTMVALCKRIPGICLLPLAPAMGIAEALQRPAQISDDSHKIKNMIEILYYGAKQTSQEYDKQIQKFVNDFFGHPVAFLVCEFCNITQNTPLGSP